MSLYLASGILDTYSFHTCTITMALVHIIYLWARTLPCDVPFRPSDAFYRSQFSVDCTITMFGSDFRRGHPSADDHPREGEVFRSLHTEAPTRHTTHLRTGEIRMTSPPAPA